jgi:hypothetical protein
VKKPFNIFLVCVFTLSMVASTFLSSTQYADAEKAAMLTEKNQPIKVIINGRGIDFVDQNPQVINGRTLVPMRKIFEELGAAISWDDATKTVTAIKGDIVIQLTIGNKKVNVNGVDQVLDVPGTIVNGRTMVPLRFVSEGLKSKVDWDSGTRTVVIVDDSEPPGNMGNRPVLISPSNNSNITDFALSFLWITYKNNIKYEIQYARNADFSDYKVFNVTRDSVEIQKSTLLSHYLPRELFEIGEWYWRVRGVDDPQNPSEWSEKTKFTINNDHSKKQLQFKVSNENPIFLAETFSDNAPLNGYASFVPEDIKNNFVVVVNRKGYNLPIKQVLQPLIDKKIYHTVFYSGATNRLILLSELEELFQSDPYIIGVVHGEEFWQFGGRVKSQSEEALKREIQLCAKYGKLFFWGDGNTPRFFNYQQIFGDPSWQKVLTENAQYINLAFKTNFTWKPYTSNGALFGAWLLGMYDHYGIWHEPWYWAKAGFGNGLGTQAPTLDADSPKGSSEQPPIIWEQIFLNSLVQGASVFHIQGQITIPRTYDPQQHAHHPAIWDRSGNKTATWDNYLYPFIKDVINKKLVPTKEQVLQNVKIAITQESLLKGNEDRKMGVSPTDPNFPYYYTVMDPLYRGTYGFDVSEDGFAIMASGNILRKYKGGANEIEPPVPYRGGLDYEILPNNTKYYFFPLLPYGTNKLFDKTILDIKDLQDVNTVTQTFDKYYEKKFEGNAGVHVVGDIFTIMSTHENKDISQDYKIPLHKDVVKSIFGKVGPHMYIVGKKMSDDTVWIKTNAQYKERVTQIKLECFSKPRIITSKNVESVWDEAKKTVTLNIRNTNAPTTIEIKK